MNSKIKGLARFPLHNLHHYRTITKVRLKWVKNRSLDHIIEVQTDIKAACLIKDAIIRSPTGCLTSKSLADSQKLIGLTVPTLRFARRYPMLFEEYPHPKYPSLACFKLSELGNMIQEKEMQVVEECEGDAMERVCRVVMMCENRMVPVEALQPLRWDLGVGDDFARELSRKYPEHLGVVEGTGGRKWLKVVGWREEWSVSGVQRLNGGSEFPMSFPRGYGAQKRVKEWMDEFQKLPYISPYEDCRGIDPKSEVMEKRVVGVLHEFLGLTIHAKTKRNYLRGLREHLNLPHNFTRIFTRYPGIFYLSLKCKTTTVALRQAYQRGRLIHPHPLATHRDKLFYLMRTAFISTNTPTTTNPFHAFDHQDDAFDDDDVM